MASDTKAAGLRKRRKLSAARQARCFRLGFGPTIQASQGMHEALAEAEARKLERGKEVKRG